MYIYIICSNILHHFQLPVLSLGMFRVQTAYDDKPVGEGSWVRETVDTAPP